MFLILAWKISENVYNEQKGWKWPKTVFWPAFGCVQAPLQKLDKVHNRQAGLGHKKGWEPLL